MSTKSKMKRALAARLLVEYAGSPARVDWVRGGILCLTIEEDEGVPGLVTVIDETEFYGGASATNAMPQVLTALRWMYANELDVSGCNVVELDSMGLWDLVRPIWQGMTCEHVTWAPVRWPGTDPRTRDALIGAFGDQARKMEFLVSEVRKLGSDGLRLNSRPPA